MSNLPPPPPTKPLADRIIKATTVTELLELMSESGRMPEQDKGHSYGDTILAKAVKILAKGHPEGKAATELARRFLAMDRRYYAPD